MTCPTCNTDLLLSERKGIEIDYCPKCRGVWLDRGELDKIIERSLEDQSAPGKNRSDRFDDDDDKRERKRGGFLGDLFDF
ncbi:MAG: zf-TFIIB domain-containing protein [Fimbriimonadaceae bacterium]|nr:zf-TFIIB domain-containing protein [Fimbriimonadaceae bacterium]